MSGDRLRFAESVLGTWDALASEERASAWRALERIDDDPISGVPLAEPVKGYWSTREGSMRVIYRLVPQSGFVVVLRITRAGEVGQS